jgi:hypothetical protein
MNHKIKDFLINMYSVDKQYARCPITCRHANQCKHLLACELVELQRKRCFGNLSPGEV